MQKLSVLPQYFLPQQLMSWIMGLFSNCRWYWLKNWMIRRFIRKYHVDIRAALSENPDDYDNFNSFFTRLLKPELRPIADGAQIASPADGSVSQIGRIEGDLLFQAKGFHFNLTALLGGSEMLAKPFHHGYFATIYLAPRDYHRVHMPIAGTLRETIYIPGKLFSVNTKTSKVVPNLFARNERLVCLFDTASGPMAVILVGAMLVSGIHTVWENMHPTPKIYLERGAELGHFKMGSTVIILFAENAVSWLDSIKEATTLQMGQPLGLLKDSGGKLEG